MRTGLHDNIICYHVNLFSMACVVCIEVVFQEQMMSCPRVLMA